MSSFHCVFERRMRRAAGAFDLAAVERDAQVVRALVALHHLDPGAEEIDQRIREFAGRRRAAGRAEHGFAGEQLLDRGDPGAGGDRAGRDALVHVADPGELRRLVARSGVAEDRLERGLRRQHAHDGAVLGGDVVEPVGGAQPAGARHVLRHRVGIAGHVPGDVARQRAAEEIETGAGLVADHDVQRLAAIEIGDALVAAARPRRRCRIATRQSHRRILL